MGQCLGVNKAPLALGKTAATQNTSHENKIPAEVFANPPDKPYRRQRRFSVSAECQSVGQMEIGPRKVHPKSNEAKDRIAEAIKSNILFQSLDDEQKKEIIDAIFEVPKKSGDVVIKQGDEGDNFYIIENGIFDVDVTKEGLTKTVLTYNNSGSFGELALMYNCPRAATVKARTDGSLWAIDRVSFRRILMDTTSRRRKQYEKFLENVDILKSMDAYERSTIADALEPKTFKAGTTVIQQGDHGDEFYIIEDGEAKVLQSPNPSVAPVEVQKRLRRGDYFGEIALLTDKPRRASVVAVSDLKVVVLDKKSFIRLLGPAEDILRRNLQSYKTYQDVISTS
mmetsp:Transcript_41211/g.66831  ORF Transcript_41211/g.66831 Transcript_41211/m.66831 type:complete len:339 (+) Transcript_41211:63-1079(+)|eukprot:CAMPEP_0184655852 /NCGR_PEP_ID=MMETSP0308-20130426/14640_1 /TAXON_ID=38269 /ORGANISM="Gloeochaete witrockiana, Strain SAG 46.84" /LENGTH=338 /DNA_ID=CAMNT_0027092635 /DNA_START=52 /DNA_END=1068 /DNA_ORIENTATION=-